MEGSKSCTNEHDGVPLSSEEALQNLAQAAPTGELQFRDEHGTTIEHKRRLVELPSGDELYTDKPAIVWTEVMSSPDMPFGSEAVVQSIFREVITKGAN